MCGLLLPAKSESALRNHTLSLGALRKDQDMMQTTIPNTLVRSNVSEFKLLGGKVVRVVLSLQAATPFRLVVWVDFGVVWTFVTF